MILLDFILYHVLTTVRFFWIHLLDEDGACITEDQLDLFIDNINGDARLTTFSFEYDI